MRRMQFRFLRDACRLGSLLLFVVACGDDSAEDALDAAVAPSGALDASVVIGSDGASLDGAVSPSGSPLYAMMIQIYGTDDRTVYVHLSKSLDLGPTLDLSRAREFAGVANFAPVNGRILVSSGLEPSITEYEIGEDLSWKQGRSVSFANYPLEDNANFYSQFVLDEQTVYLPFDVTSRLIWNPSAMTITQVLEDSKLELMKGGLKASPGGNRNGIRFEGPVQRSFIYVDEDYFAFAQESAVAIYDPASHGERQIVSLPCPGVDMPSRDEQGNTYYSTWNFQGTRALFGQGPKPCIVRLKPDHTLDEAWTTDLRDLTGGRHVNNFRYIGKGRAIGNVLHHELLAANWSGGYDPKVAEQIAKEGDYWRVWMFDLNQRTAKPVEGIDVVTGMGTQFATLEGRTFLFVQYERYGRTRIYEIDESGLARRHADTQGDVFKWLRVR
jgi:hypothetical protein